MKKLLLLLLFASQISFSQTKDETIDWLNSKLKEYTDSHMGEYKFQLKIIEGYGETILITKLTDVGFGPSTTYFSFKPMAITSVNLTSAYRTDGKLGIELLSKNKSVYRDGKEFVDEIPIYIKPAPDEMVKKIQKGIMHLLNLTGNPIKPTKELFTD